MSETTIAYVLVACVAVIGGIVVLMRRGVIGGGTKTQQAPDQVAKS
ncbi:MAG TPA: hypothetical protein VKE74_00090 [Gemmataceae bacterium]|nr:hypothetical protein [Gemmataceae bacterium]